MLALWPAACSGSGGSGSSSKDLRLVGVSVPENAVWEINRPIELQFSHPIDFRTVTSNTIHIRSTGGVPATGSFSFKEVDADGDGTRESIDEHVVVFQPNCPTRADYADAGFAPGGVEYFILLAADGNSIRSQDGRSLRKTFERRLRTPDSQQREALFLDRVAGAVSPVLRPHGAAGVVEGVTYVEIGGDPDPRRRVFFERDPLTQTVTVVAGPDAKEELPLNLYADPEQRVALVIELDQPIDPSPVNLSAERVRLEFVDALGDWTPIETRTELVANCTRTGARLRLEPVGILPAGRRFRAVLRSGFEDITGETSPVDRNDFAVASTETIDFPGLEDPHQGGDELFEPFDFGSDSSLSLEDEYALYETPQARWKDGSLTSAFDFEGAGGPRGTFDWVVHESVTLDTSSDQIIGGPGGIPTATLNVIGGVVDVRHVHIKAGAQLRIQGPNPLRINATGDVRIDGELDASGFNAKNVAAFSNGTLPEIGATGAAGGGRGGNSSEVTNNSTPRGGTGWGPFDNPGLGGQGGESGYSAGAKDTRRPGGGGGGRFVADVDPTIWGLYAGNGFDGHPESRGAVTNRSPALGGSPGDGPFADGDPTNDFFGVRALTAPDGNGGYEITGLVRGELSRHLAGFGGGGGGDALPSSSFPTPNWVAASDDKGGGGGGGGGAVRIRALGEISFGPGGTLRSQGGHGGAGGNTSFLDHVGGTGGSGSGGHVILESATRIDFTGDNPGVKARFQINLRGGPEFRGPMNARDMVPEGISHGGSGGPGLLQLHVPSLHPPSDDLTQSDIVVARAALEKENPLKFHVRGQAVQLVPTFGARSKARSRWVSLGGADVDPAGGSKLVRLLFGGVRTDAGANEGKVQTADGRVLDPEPILGPTAIPSTDVALLEDGLTVRFTGTALDALRLDPGPRSSDLYLRTPELLHHFLLRVVDAADPAQTLDLDVVAAGYDAESGALDLTFAAATENLDEFVARTGEPHVSLIPRFFRVRTGGRADELPDSAFVRVRLQGAPANESGRPDETAAWPWTSDATSFDSLAPGALAFFRFEVEFDLDAAGAGVTPETEPISLDFLRVPFRF